MACTVGGDQTSLTVGGVLLLEVIGIGRFKQAFNCVPGSN